MGLSAIGESAGRGSVPAGRVWELAGRASEPDGEALEPAGRPQGQERQRKKLEHCRKLLFGLLGATRGGRNTGIQ